MSRRIAAMGLRKGLLRSAAALLICVAASLSVGQQRAAAGPPYIVWTRTAVTATAGEPRGYVQFQDSCSICHGHGPGRPGTRALAAKYRGALPALLEQRRDLTPEFIKLTVRHGATVMPPFRKTELSDADLDAIAAYLTRKRR